MPQHVEEIVFGIDYNQSTHLPKSVKKVTFKNPEFRGRITSECDIENIEIVYALEQTN